MKLRRFVVTFVLTLLVLAFFSWILSAPPQTLEERQSAGAGRQGHPTQAVGNQEANELQTDIERARAGRQNYANDVIGSILYIQDPRTTPPTCYGHLSVTSQWTGGPALATVPCERIPSDLLIIAIVK